MDTESARIRELAATWRHLAAPSARLDVERLACSRKDSAGRYADYEPFSGAAHAAPGATAFGEAQGGVAFPAEGLGLGLFVGEVGGGGGQARLAGLAVHGEVVKRL